MDKEPTQEQIKEFWEWCGFRPGVPEVVRDLTNPRYRIESADPALALFWAIWGVIHEGGNDGNTTEREAQVSRL